MRIAIYHNLPSGGAKRTLAEACRRLSQRHTLDAYSLSSAEHDYSDLRPYVSAYYQFPFRAARQLHRPLGRFNQLQRLRDLIRLQRVAERVAADIDARGYDVALVHPCRFEQGPSVLRYLRRTPAVYYCQEPLRTLYEAMPRRPYDAPTPYQLALDGIDPMRWLYRRTLRRTDQQNTRSARAVLVNSRFTAAEVRRIYRIEPTVSYHGVDVETFRPTGVARQRFVLSVGSLTPLKGFDFVIQALARLPRATRPELVVASNFENPPERTYLERLARDLDVGLVLHGSVTEAKLVELYNHAQLVAYAPLREPFGLVALEAMACATPLVAVAEGGVPESVADGETGLLAARDPSQFADAIGQLIAAPALARRLGDQGRAHVLRNWTWAGAIDTLERQLAEIA